MILQLVAFFFLFFLVLFAMHLVDEQNLMSIATKGAPMRFKNAIQGALIATVFVLMYLIVRHPTTAC